MDPRLDHLWHTLRKDAWFGGLPAAMQAGLIGLSGTRRMKKGQSLFFRGDPTDGVYALIEGRLDALTASEHGDEAVQIQMEPVFWFGEMGLYDKLPRAHHVRAVEPSLVMWMDNQRLRAFLNTQPEFWFHFGLLLTQKLRLALFMLDGRMLVSNELHVARVLLLMSQHYAPGQGKSRSRLLVQQKELAEVLGMSRQTVNNVLQRLKAAGLIELAYSQVDIIDLPALEEKVQFGNWLPTASR